VIDKKFYIYKSSNLIIQVDFFNMTSYANRTNASSFLQSIKRKRDEIEDVKTTKDIQSPSKIKKGLCHHKGCTKYGSFCSVGQKNKYCATHMREIDPSFKNREPISKIQRKLCKHEGCTKYAGFGPIGQKKMYCATHMREMKISTFVRTGRFCKGGCGKQPIYGPPDSNSFEYCQDCKPAGYMNIKKKLYPICKIVECHKHSMRGNTYCRDHMSHILDVPFSGLITPDVQS